MTSDGVPVPNPTGMAPAYRSAVIALPSHLGRWALALSIVGVVTVPFVAGVILFVPSIVLAIVSLARPGFLRGTSIAALIVSAAGIALFAVLLVVTLAGGFV